MPSKTIPDLVGPQVADLTMGGAVVPSLQIASAVRKTNRGGYAARQLNTPAGYGARHGSYTLSKIFDSVKISSEHTWLGVSTGVFMILGTSICQTFVLGVRLCFLRTPRRGVTLHVRVFSTLMTTDHWDPFARFSPGLLYILDTGA